MPNSLDVQTTAREGLCCFDIGFGHIVPSFLFFFCFCFLFFFIQAANMAMRLFYL